MIRFIENRRSSTCRALKAALENARGNILVNWTGAPVAEPSLNQHAFTNKLRQATRLRVAGVPTIEVSLRREGAEWLPRRLNHQQGYDFTNQRFIRNALHSGADFWVKKENIVDEYRIHVFRTRNDNMRVLRVAHRVPSRPEHHPWVRSHRLGWKLSYVGGASDGAKQIARNAVRALQLDFGAVDIGILATGDPIVLEVNTCPGLEGGTLQLYADGFKERAEQ
jgi:hypothetical protein